MTRQLIQYDLDQPPSSSIPLDSQSLLGAGPRQSPTKKRKRNNHNSQRPASGAPQQTKGPMQHWDDPGSTTIGVVYDDQEGGTSIDAGSVEVSYEDGEVEYGEGGESGVVDADADAEWELERGMEEEESRPLTHEEIWDDSALVNAWNSAEAEYKACILSFLVYVPPRALLMPFEGLSWYIKIVEHWACKKSPRWPNKPKPRPLHEEDGDLGPGTAPTNFDTFIPTHDPSLGASATPTAPATYPFFVPPPSTTTVSRDEAFNNALSAMYWSGYWTAVYHCQGQTSEKNTDHDWPTEQDVIDVDEEVQDLVPTQR